jgi:hypothetical protein
MRVTEIPKGVCTACYKRGARWDTPTEDGACYECHSPMLDIPASLRVSADEPGASLAHVPARANGV